MGDDRLDNLRRRSDRVVQPDQRVVTLNPAEKTVEFHIPALRRTDEQGRITTFDLTWINPDYNSQFCHYYDQTPGDLVNFYLVKDTTDLGDDPVDLPDLDELLCWLKETKSHS
jgi:hypothetical protein